MLPIRETKRTRGKLAAKEDLDFEIRFFEGISRHDPNFIEALQILGDAYTRTGQWEKGLRVDERLARLCPDNSLVFYNLACSYSLMNHIEEAFGALREAVRLGYDDARWMVKDPDLANLRQDTRFKKLQSEVSSRTAK